MRGIILAGGHGTRLKPITNYINKHLVPVFNLPMIEYQIATLKSLGITDMLIVSGREHAGDFLEYLGSGIDRGLKFTYKVQEEAGGIAQALSLADDFIDYDGHFAVILGDNIFENTFNSNMRRDKSSKVFLKEVDDASRFGVARLNEHKEIRNIVEKPKNIDKGLAVTGLYIYPSTVFGIINRLEPSARGELEITDVNQYYARLGALDYEVLSGFWSDAGTPESLAVATQWAISKSKIDD